MQTGVEGFIQDMTELGFEPTLEDELVIYKVVAVGGVYPGTSLATAVGIDELQPWPHVPAALASLSCRPEVLAHQQQAVSEDWMVDAQPSASGVGRCFGWSRVGEPCPGSPQ